MADYSYRVRIEEDTTPALQELAAGLGFVATRPGKFLGAPSPGSLLDALAAAYRADPDNVLFAMSIIGLGNKPQPPAEAEPVE
jgi:hypothetical protein